jgi:hypothetical protein
MPFCDLTVLPQEPEMTDAPGARPTRARNLLALALGVVGVVVSWSQFVPYLNANAWSFVAFWTDAFTTSGINGLTIDLFAAASALFVMVWHDRARLGVAKIVALVVVTVVLGVCLGLPLWLYWRDPE